MNLLSMLNLPTPTFNPNATGKATHVVLIGVDGEVEATAEADVMLRWIERDGAPALRIELPNAEAVEVRLGDALPFVSDTIGVDVAAVFGQLGALLG